MMPENGETFNPAQEAKQRVEEAKIKFNEISKRLANKHMDGRFANPSTPEEIQERDKAWEDLQTAQTEDLPNK